MFNIIAWFKKSRKKAKISSLQEVEQMLNSAPYSSDELSTEFKQELINKLLAARRSNKKVSMETTSFFRAFRWKVWIPAVSLGVIILLLLPLVTPLFGGDDFFLVDRANASDAFKVIAEKEDTSGIDADTTFKVTAKMSVKEEELKKSLRFEPEAGFALTKLSETEFVVTPENTLEGGKVHNIIIDSAFQDENDVVVPHEFRFAFQVKDTFKILKSLPGDRTNNVPTNTGIEITFSHSSVEIAELQKHFSISPDVSGRIEKHGRALVFIPHDPLKNGTLYKVNVSKGMQLAGTNQIIDEDYYFEFFTRETYASDLSSYLRFNYSEDGWSSFAPNTAPHFDVTEKNISDEARITVYKINSLNDLRDRSDKLFNLPRWIYRSYNSYSIRTQGLPILLESTVGDSLTRDDFGGNSLTLPEINATGIYVLEVMNEDGKGSYQVFQITNLKAFFIASRTKSFVWIHNAETKKPVPGARISFSERSEIFETGNEGISVFDTTACSENENDYGEFMSIKSGSDEVSLLLNRGCNDFGPQDVYGYDYYRTSYDYWKTLSVDRGIYLPTDSILFWGVAKRRKNHKPEELIAEINSYENGVLKKISINSSELGTFNGKFDIRNARPGSYMLYIKDKNEQMISSQYFTIATFQKPLYDINVKIDKSNVLVGEKVKVVVHATFFDGTPARDMELKYYNDITKSGTVRTDKNGEASVIIDTSNLKERNATSSNIYYDNPSYQSIRFLPTSTEYSDISGAESFKVYRADVAVKFDYSSKGHTKGPATGTVKKLNLGGSDPYEAYEEVIPNYPITGSVIKVVRDKIPNGETYDPITKTVTPRFKYERREEKVRDFSATTNEKGEFKVEYPQDKEEYMVVARVKDSAGRINGAARIFYGQNEVPEETYINVSLRDMNAPDYGTGASMKTYKIGDKVNLQMQVNSIPHEKEGEYVFYTMQSGLLDIKASNSPNYEFAFEKQHAPNVVAGIVWFDGTYYNSTGMSYDDLYLQFKRDTKKLDISVTADSSSYKPGEKAELTVETKDADGKPVSAEVNVKLIDEAIYALRETYDNTLETIYSGLPSGILTTLTTSRQPRSLGGGKGGGGGDEGNEGVRSAFKNTAYFGVVNTDINGKATIDVDLPDDITTFRITAQGFTKDIEAGMSRTPLVISQPFFLDLTMNDVYLSKDKPAIRLRTFGTELADGADVAFDVSIPTLGVKGKTITAKAGSETWYTLPELSVGEHAITVRAKSGSLSDAVMKKVNVVDSLVTESVAETRTLTDSTSLKDINSPRAKLVFSLNPYGEYYSALESLKWGYSGRLDAEIASVTARELLATYFGEKLPETSKNLAIYQNNTGGLMLLPYDSADLDITYRAVLVGAKYFDTVSVERYFDDIINSKDSNREEVAKALAGKAALGLPVLNELKTFFGANKAEMTPGEKLVVAFGLASLGDHGLASEILNEVLKDKTERDGDTMLVNFTRDEQENLELTAMTLAVAATTNHPYAEYLWNGLQNFRTSRTLTSLEQVIALRAFLKRLPPVQEGSVKFNLSGRSDTVKLKKAGTDQLMVSDTELKQISFSDIKGHMAVTIYRDVPLGSAGQNYSNTLAVAREYKANGKKTSVLEEGDIVTVTLTPRIGSSGDKSGFVVSDTLPAGLLPLANVNYGYFSRSGKGGVGGGQIISHPYFVEGQRVSFRYWPQYDKGSITYLARVVSKGTFNAEPAVIQSLDNPSRINISDATQIEIK